jgi:phospholipid/cholesterol/gamma-HCH transport system permease protein
MRQCYQMGTRALPFIAVSGIFVGFGIVAQALLWLEVFGGTALLGGFLSVVLVREIAPVLVGLIVIGRSGSMILVELGTMKAEGQVHMLDAQGVDPFLYLVLPRVLALSICMFCLTIAFVAVALVAGFVSGTLLNLTTFTFLDFIHRAVGSMGQKEYLLITVKTLTIGFVVGLISCKAALALSGSAANVLDILPRSFADSVLATLVISIALTILM